jgi:DNA-binding NtrC family response regulator
LRERREDIIPLLQHYLSRLAARTGKEIHEISPDALSALYDYDYPGNVRELTNILERAFVLCHEEQIDLVHLPAEVGSGESRLPLERPSRLKPSEHKLLSSPENEADSESQPPERSGRRGPIRPEVQRLRDALDAHGWRRDETARALGISRSTLWRRMKEYGLA